MKKAKKPCRPGLFKRFVLFAKRYLRNVFQDDALGLAAQTAYYLTLSVFPLMLVLASALQRARLGAQLDRLVMTVPESVRPLLSYVFDKPPDAGMSLFGVGALIWSGASAVWALMRGIFLALAEPRKEGVPAMPLAAYPLAVVFLLLLTLAIVGSLWLLVFGETVLRALGLNAVMLESVLVWIGVSVFLFLAVWLLYYFTPGYKIRLRHLWPGAALAAGGWVALSVLFEVYIRHFTNYSALYGGIGAFLGLVLWLFFIAALVLLGAELNATLGEKRKRSPSERESPLPVRRGKPTKK